MRLIPFGVRFGEEQKDHDLAAKLHAELAGILAWAVRGCQAWQASGLGMPPEIAQATADYRGEMDVVSWFIRARYEWEFPCEPWKACSC